MLPAPRRKLPGISPILKADTVRLHVSREKEKDWDDTKVFSRTAAGKLAGSGRVDLPGRGER
jgi:hypothetical protein